MAACAYLAFTVMSWYYWDFFLAHTKRALLKLLGVQQASFDSSQQVGSQFWEHKWAHNFCCTLSTFYSLIYPFKRIMHAIMTLFCVF